MNEINLNFLKKLKLAADSKDFSTAAKSIGTSSGTLSTQLEELEKSLGNKLFLRKGRKKTTTLTESGKDIYEKYNLLEEAIVEASLKRHHFHENKFRIRIKTTPGLSGLIIPQFHKSLLEKSSQYLLEVDSFCENFVSGDEILIRADILQMEDNEIKHLFDLKFSFYCSESYIKGRTAPRNLSDLSEHSILAPDLLFNYESFEKASPKLGINVNSNPSLVANDVSTLVKSCHLGQGVTELPVGYPGTENLIRIDLDDYDLVRKIYYSYNRSAYNRPEFVDFLNFFGSYFKKK